MTTRSRGFLKLAVLSLGVSTLAAQAPGAKPLPVPAGTNLNDPQSLFSFASSVNGLETEAGDKNTGTPAVPPWHLKATYETFDERGTQSGSGTFEEWHVSQSQWKRAYSGAHFTQTEYRTQDGHYFETDAGSAPWPDSLVEHALVHPMPDKEDTEDTSPTLQEQPFGKLKLSCMMFTQSGLHEDFGVRWPIGLFPTYCFGKNNGMLRFGLFDGSIEEIFNSPAIFAGHYIAKEIELSDENKPLLRVHLQDLRSISPAVAASLAPPSKPYNADLKNTIVPPGVMSGYKLRGVDIRYPEEAKRQRIQGKVVLKAVIGTDGRIHQLRVISSPHSSLTISAMLAVERWVYKPYLLNGRPVSVETTVNVTFNMTDEVRKAWQ